LYLLYNTTGIFHKLIIHISVISTELSSYIGKQRALSREVTC